MGSQEFVRTLHQPVDFMVCMDLVGHRLGSAALPDDVGGTLFALGAERSHGTLERMGAWKRAEDGLVVRPTDAGIIPPLSDYEPFWRRGIPFLFLSAGRPRYYHTPDDTPDKLDLAKCAATARWLSRFVRDVRDREPVSFHEHGRAHLATLEELAELLELLAEFSPDAELALLRVRVLRDACDARGHLPGERHPDLGRLVAMIEGRLG